MNKNLMKAIDVIIMIITIPVMIVFYIPFAIFKGLTSEFVFDKYLNIWRKILNILLYPIVKYQERKEHYEELKQRIKYYRKECGRLNDIINELEKGKKKDKKWTGSKQKIFFPIIKAFAFAYFAAVIIVHIGEKIK